MAKIKPKQIEDLTKEVMSGVSQAGGTAIANIELAFARGFQLGYETAIYDNVRGRLDAGRALKYTHAKEVPTK